VHDDSDTFEALGRYLRKLRGNKTQPAVGRRLGVTKGVVSRAETGRQLSPWLAGRYDEVFDTGGRVAPWRERAERARKRAELGEEPRRHGEPAESAGAGGGFVVVLPPPGAVSELWQPAGIADGRSLALPDGLYRVITSTGEVAVDMPLDRRLFVTGMGLGVPLAGMEQTRHGLLGSLAADHASADVDEWQEIAREYALSVYRTPPAELLPGLQVDAAMLGDTLRRTHAEPAARELQRIAALLAAFTAFTVADLGDLRSSRRWWRTAKQAADESGDTHARLWVRGKEVVNALYERRPVPAVLDLVTEAEDLSASVQAPPTALPHLLCGKSQTLALAGRAAPAESALRDVRDNFDRLPAHTTRDTESCFGFSETRVHFAESYVYSHLGDFTRADQAQTAALALYPATALFGPVKIKLQQALCLVRTGDVAPGVEHAHTVMTGLPREHHDRVIVDLGRKVLDAVPVGERGRDGVREFRTYLDEAA
jgi:hypothetical protein